MYWIMPQWVLKDKLICLNLPPKASFKCMATRKCPAVTGKGLLRGHSLQYYAYTNSSKAISSAQL